MLLSGLSTVDSEKIIEYLDSFDTVLVENRASIEQALSNLSAPAVLVTGGDAIADSETALYRRLATACSKGLVHVVFLLSSQNESSRAYRYLPIGCFDTIQKPIDLAELQNVLEIHWRLLTYKQLEHLTTEGDSLLQSIFIQAPFGILISRSGEITTEESESHFNINPIFEKITGWSREDMRRLGWREITHPDDLKKEMVYFQSLRTGQIQNYQMEKRYRKPDGSYVWVQIVVARIEMEGNNQFDQICIVQDISDRKKLELHLAESERSKGVLLSHLPGMAYRCSYDEYWTMLFVSDRCYKLTGYESKDILHNAKVSFRDIIVADYREKVRKSWGEAIEQGKQYSGEYEIVTAFGQRKWVLEFGQGIYDEFDNVVALEGIILDITERKFFEEELIFLNEHDRWTGLLNRRSLESRLQADSLKPLVGNQALVGINLSPVSSLSLTYGFDHSREVLKKVADALQHFSDSNFQLYNTYENRFLYYVQSYEEKDLLISFSEQISAMLKSILTMERVGWGIGIIEITEDNRHDIDHLLKCLLIASETVMGTSTNDSGYCFFNISMEKRIERKKIILSELSEVANGIDTHRLFLQYQPILDLSTNQIVYLEALARFQNRAYGLLAPLEFIPIAEKSKLIGPLGEIICIEAIDFLKALKHDGYEDLKISINISALQFLQDGFVEMILSSIHRAQIDPRDMCLEITESVFAPNFSEINKTLGILQSEGIQIALDDFGTGYSSFASVHELNISCLKIDKRFIDTMTNVGHEQAITGDIISMAHKLGYKAVAEGVEHPLQLEYLRWQLCDYVQGFLISRPKDAASVTQYLASVREGVFCDPSGTR